MEVLLSFIIKNFEGHNDHRIQKEYPEYLPFIDVLRDILKFLNSNITLDKIAVISAIKGLFTFEDIRKTVKEIVALHLLEFTITKRDLVNGPNLMLKELIPPTTEERTPILKDEVVSPEDVQFGYLKPKIEPESAPTPPTPEPMPELKPLETEIMKEKIVSLGSIGGKGDEITRDLTPSVKEEIKSTKIEAEDAKEAIDRMEAMLREPVAEDQLLDAKIPLKSIDFGAKKESYEKEKVLPPPKSAHPPGSAPKSPQTLRSSATQELKKLFERKDGKKPTPPVSPPGSGPSAPLPAPVRRALKKPSIQEPTPPPPPSPPSPPSPEPVVTSASSKSFSFKQKKKGKKMRARSRSFDDEVEEAVPILEEEIKDEGIIDDFKDDFGEAEEAEEREEREEETLSDLAGIEAPTELPLPLTSAILPELAEIAKEIESSKEYQKNIAIEYFDKMNPKKYYPLIIDISDIEQATTISEENILTGERKIQVKEKMAVVLKSSIVKVKPMFPGCSIVPEERFTDLDNKEDKLTFYVTPLVDDEIEDGRIEFIDSEGNIFHSASTPTKVEDPRYARMIALYGGLASFLPKILETLGFNFASELKMATLLPFLQNVLGDLNLSNFIGISGIIITIIICIITVAVRKPNSVKKKFKVARVGRLKSAIKARR